MGSANSRMESASSRRSSIKRIIYSAVSCGSSCPSSSSRREMDDNPAELLVNSAQLAIRNKLNPTRKHNDLPVGNTTDIIRTRTESSVSSGRSTNPSVVPRNNIWRKFLIENGDKIPSHQSLASVSGIETASTSYALPPSPGCAYSTEIVGLANNTNGVSYQIDEAMSNSSILHRHVPEESLSCDVSTESNAPEAVNLSSIECASASHVSDSPTELNLLRDESTQVERPSSSIFLSEREEDRDHGNNMPGHGMDESSNTSSDHYAETSTHGTRRNNRRLFWDAFLRHNSRRDTDSRSFSSSSHNLDGMRSNNRLRDSSGDFLSNDVRGDIQSSGSRFQGGSRTEIMERDCGSRDSVDPPQAAACPRGIHVDGLCSCRPGSSAEEYAPHTGISGVALLAEALFEVLDQIYRQPMTLSMSTTSAPAPESVVDSFPVKIHWKPEISEYANDAPQCYICLDEYEEGDNIRILPCHHEFHTSCVDKWLKEVHGVCPLCRGDVGEGHAEDSTSNEEVISH